MLQFRVSLFLHDRRMKVASLQLLAERGISGRIGSVAQNAMGLEKVFPGGDFGVKLLANDPVVRKQTARIIAESGLRENPKPVIKLLAPSSFS